MTEVRKTIKTGAEGNGAEKIDSVRVINTSYLMSYRKNTEKTKKNVTKISEQE
jgi:phosphoribosylformylglycinamidine (FGAM) synthase PurS component